MENRKTILKNIYRRFQIPVVVCGAREEYPVLYANPSAMALLNPLPAMADGPAEVTLETLFRFASPDQEASFFAALEAMQNVKDYPLKIINYEKDVLDVTVSANIVEEAGGTEIVMYIRDATLAGERLRPDAGNILSTVLYLATHTKDVEEAINTVIAFVGTYAGVSRTYIMEEISAKYICNTYEWCDTGIAPMMDRLQTMRKADYQYDVMVQDGLYIIDNVRKLPPDNRARLESQQVRAMGSVPLSYQGRTLGFVGFDDCIGDRKWSRDEISLLRNIANVIVSLLVRRNSEHNTRRSLDIMRKISDNVEYAVYVNDADTFDVLFANQPFADMVQREPQDVTGRKCWQLLQQNQDKQCDFCPLNDMLDENGNVANETASREFKNEINGKWYLIRDTLTEWLDGKRAYIHTMLEITSRKEYENQLEEYASTDMMTGAHNRVWGTRIMGDMLAVATADRPASLVFLDIDGLKNVNDTYGHEAGDALIIAVAETIRATIRQSDFICRWGGDEFVLVLECGTEPAGAIMQKVLHSLRAASRAGKKPYKISFSYGIAPFEQQAGQTLEDIVSLADRRMYHDKLAGRPVR